MADNSEETVIINGVEVKAARKVKLWEQTVKPMSRSQIRKMIAEKREELRETRKAKKDAEPGS